MAWQSESVLSVRAQALLRALRDWPHERPATARELALAIGVRGGHETLRRRVREVAEFARQHLGATICSGAGSPQDCGYWLARDTEEWHRHEEAKRMGAKFQFVKLAQRERVAFEVRAGQGRLFADREAWAR